jgi:murein DD-endopeptidase MepM/ murein hydrolase activator NlpD
MRLPPRTRILLVTDEDRPGRQVTLTRRGLVWLLAGAGLLLVAVVVAATTWAILAGRAARLPGLERELAQANGQLSSVRSLEHEVERLHGMQDQVLTMLGVRPPAEPDSAGKVAAGATVDTTVEGLGSDTAGRRAPLPGPALTQAGALGLIALPPPDLWPVKGQVTQGFVPKDAKGHQPPHDGIDLVAPPETPIRAAGKGIVARADWDDFLGNYVEITHGLGYVTVYGHCSRLIVRVGDRVDRGQEIAFLGGTGRASAPHLHFEVWKDNKAIDPQLVIPGDPAR